MTVAGVVAVPSVASGALPTVNVDVVTAPLTHIAHTGVTVTSSCASGRLVSGGSYLRFADGDHTGPLAPGSSPGGFPTPPGQPWVPTNGLVMGGTVPSQGPIGSSPPIDHEVTDGQVDPSNWMTIANFTGQSEIGDQASTFAMCATAGGPSHTVVKVASKIEANAQQVNTNVTESAPGTPPPAPPKLTTATCGGGQRLVGGGAMTTTPDTVNNGATGGNNQNLKPLASYPSTSTGAPAADGSTTTDSWSAFGSSGAGAGSPTDVVKAFAICSTDAGTPPVQVVRNDVSGPLKQTGTTTVNSPATCPSGTRLLGGGYQVTENLGSLTGLQPQQGFHMRGSYPTSGGTWLTGDLKEALDGATDPDTWTSVGQLGGQTLGTTQRIVQRGFALCAQAAPLAAPTLSTTASAPVTVGNGISDSATLASGASPTGTITFKVYGPGDTGCATPLATSTATVSGNGTYQSAAFTANTVGTYQWVASYGGDGANDPASGACGDVGESVAVSAPQPTITTCAVTALRAPGQSASGKAEQDVTLSDPGGVTSIDNVQVANGAVFVGGSAGTRIDDHPTNALPPSTTSTVVTAVKATPGLKTVWSFDATNWTGQITHCA